MKVGIIGSRNVGGGALRRYGESRALRDVLVAPPGRRQSTGRQGRRERECRHA